MQKVSTMCNFVIFDDLTHLGWCQIFFNPVMIYWFLFFSVTVICCIFLKTKIEILQSVNVSNQFWLCSSIWQNRMWRWHLALSGGMMAKLSCYPLLDYILREPQYSVTLNEMNHWTLHFPRLACQFLCPYWLNLKIYATHRFAIISLHYLKAP